MLLYSLQTYASWGIDSLKMDGCNSIHTHAILDPAYEFMGEAMNKTGRAPAHNRHIVCDVLATAAERLLLLPSLLPLEQAR